MGSCTCKQGQVATSTSYGGTLDFIWSGPEGSYTWNGPRQYCNPYNCSNKACFNKGCAEARAGFCQRYSPDGRCYKASSDTSQKNTSSSSGGGGGGSDWLTGSTSGIPNSVLLGGGALLLVMIIAMR